jgi:hypothetical protein
MSDGPVRAVIDAGQRCRSHLTQLVPTGSFPACYSGRYPHIHIEVYRSLTEATIYSNAVLTSQMAMPAAICSTVFENATGYSVSVTNCAAVTTSTDNVFSSSTSAQIAAQTPLFPEMLPTVTPVRLPLASDRWQRHY